MEVKVKEKMRVIGNNLDTGILGVKCHIFNEPGVLVKDRLECQVSKTVTYRRL